MPGYRRFIAYVYEYRKGKKESNCGFIKVEARDERCTMEVHLHCVGLTPETECRIYGFVRKDGLMNGILLGSCDTGEDIVECLIETDALDMGGSGISLGRMGGMILITGSGGFFGTEWDDQPIRPDNFREMRERRDAEKEAGMQGKKPETQERETVAAAVECECVNEKETEEKFKKEDDIESEERDMPPKVTDENEDDIESEERDMPPKVTDENEDVIESEEKRDANQNGADAGKEDMEEAADGNEKRIAQRPPQCPQPPQRPVPLPEPPFGETFCPFRDSDIVQCWKIHPQDFSRFPRRMCALRNNRFLLHGYNNFGHILLCKRANGQYILGVPGGYDQQEHFMASMFGFPFFRESHLIELPGGRGGYWYRLIDAPDFR